MSGGREGRGSHRVGNPQRSLLAQAQAAMAKGREADARSLAVAAAADADLVFANNRAATAGALTRAIAAAGGEIEGEVAVGLKETEPAHPFARHP